MRSNPGTGRRYANWQPSCTHWINLSEKAGMKFFGFGSPGVQTQSEKVLRGSHTQGVRNSFGNSDTRTHSQLGVVGSKSTHTADTKRTLNLCDEVQRVTGGCFYLLDKSNHTDTYAIVKSTHTFTDDTDELRGHSRTHTQYDTNTRKTHSRQRPVGSRVFQGDVGSVIRSANTRAHYTHTPYTYTVER